MTRRIVVLGLGIGILLALGAGPVSSQEAQKPDEAVAKRTTQPDRRDWQAAGTQGAVAAGGRGAVAAGLEILKGGGNAADAAAATIFALSVTDARSFCFGGEVPIMIYDSRHHSVTVIAGQGRAPRLATRDEFAKRGGIPLRGILAAAVPAALDACLTLLDRFGTLTFAQVVAPTRELLQHPTRPEPWHADLGKTLATLVETEAQAHPAGSSANSGDRSRRPAPRRRCILPRPDRPAHRRVVASQRRPDPLCRSGHAYDASRGAGRHRLSRLDRLQVWRLDTGPVSSGSPSDLERHRSGGDGP